MITFCSVFLVNSLKKPSKEIRKSVTTGGGGVQVHVTEKTILVSKSFLSNFKQF